MVPTLKFSATTSARSASSVKSSTPFGVLRSRVTPSLLRSRYWAAGTRSSTPWRRRFTPSETRSRPRSRDSTLITRAPMSASSMVQNGIAMTCPRSSTVTSLRAWSIGRQLSTTPEISRVRRGGLTLTWPRPIARTIKAATRQMKPAPVKATS
jgi:hypothetical protein